MAQVRTVLTVSSFVVLFYPFKASMLYSYYYSACMPDVSHQKRLTTVWIRTVPQGNAWLGVSTLSWLVNPAVTPYKPLYPFLPTRPLAPSLSSCSPPVSSSPNPQFSKISFTFKFCRAPSSNFNFRPNIGCFDPNFAVPFNSYRGLNLPQTTLQKWGW